MCRYPLNLSLCSTSSDESERLVNSRYADIVDVLLPSRAAPYPDGLRDVYDSYRVVILSGDLLLSADGSVGDPAALKTALWGWVARGGVLLLHGRDALANNLTEAEIGVSLGRRKQIH
eukprot:COSAG04_NODE_1541_length_6419_cov_3.373259_1_plen_117_part_10